MRTKHAVTARSSRSCPSARFPRSPRRLLGAAAIPSLILVAALAGCSGSESSSSLSSGSVSSGSGAMAAAPAAAASAPAPAPSAPYNAAAGAASSSSVSAGTGVAAKYVATGEQLIYTAQLSVRAANVSAAISRATSIVSGAGGYVSAENASSGQGQPSQASATVTFKIPVAAYATTLAALSGGGLGTQLSLSQQAQDVTQQVADVGSRVTSDEQAIAQLRTLLKHAGDVGSLLTMQNQIDSQESDLESMLAQQNALDHETAFATVTLALVGPKASVVKPRAKTAAPPGLAGGLAGGWHALRVTIAWLLTVVGAVAPFVAALAVIGGLGWWARRRVIRRRKPAA